MPGQQYDVETGLFYNNARYYDPLSGRYISSDAIGLAGGLNTYLYANGSPVSSVDPTGEWVPLLAAVARVSAGYLVNAYRLNQAAVLAAEAASGVSVAGYMANMGRAGKAAAGKLCALEVGTYGQQAARSVKDGLTPDHIPSIAAVTQTFERTFGPMQLVERSALRRATPTIAIPSNVHVSSSRTYGGRNTVAQILADSHDLANANKLDRMAYQQALRQQGYTQRQIDDAFNELERLHKAYGMY